ncbi:MAG: oxidoreductase [Patescibacteria group bacterium]|nr:oxidoreductase [Patescibacteria group bacterium]
MKKIDDFLNGITMYRLVMYELFAFVVAGLAFSFFGFLPFSPFFLIYSFCFITAITWLSNRIFSRTFHAPSNAESVYITAFILVLIVTPPSALIDTHYLALAFWASTWAMASKYIVAIGKKHVFNPAGFGVCITGIVLGLSASWWVGTPLLVPFVLIGGLLMVRKVRRFDLWAAFIAVFSVGTLYDSVVLGHGVLSTLAHSFLYAPAFFFATVMLTEPMTTPPDKFYRTLYGALVGFLFLPNIHISSFYLSPETALLVGNLFSYIVSPKYKPRLVLQERVQLSRDVYEFVFVPPRKVSFAPGQYMEWTLAHKKPDSRGIRRYFTIASSPTEKELRLGVKFYEKGSTYKKALLSLRPGMHLFASQLAGDFTLPKNKKEKLAFVAGGIGSTPFRSMIKYLLDKKERRDIVFLYSNRSPEDAVYKELFDRAERELGIRTVYVFTDEVVPSVGSGPKKIDAPTIAEQVPDHRERIFYISGPQKMVEAIDGTLRAMGTHASRIKKDYFPGFA